MTEHSKRSRKLFGSFAETISNQMATMDYNEDDDDTSSCSDSSLSDPEENPFTTSLGSFPCPSMDIFKKYDIPMSSHLSVVFEEEDECETSFSDNESENDCTREGGTLPENEIEENNEEATENDLQNTNSPKILGEIASISCSTTVGSSSDGTCQTISAMALSFDTASVTSDGSKHSEEELDSRLSAILAMKEVIFEQREVIRDITKDKRRLSLKLDQRKKNNRKLRKRNQHLEEELKSLTEELLNTRMELIQQKEDAEVVQYSKGQESFIDVLNRINEKRKAQSKLMRQQE